MAAGGVLASLLIKLGFDAREVETGTRKVSGLVDRLGGSSAAAGAAIGAVAGAASVAALRLGTDYKDAVDSIRVGTGATGDALADLEAQFRSVGGRVPDEMGSVSQVIADLNTRTGQTGDSLGMLAESILDLSRLTGGDAASSVESLTRVYGDWNIATADQVLANDKLFRASQATGASIDALSRQVVQFGAPLRQLGFGFEEAIGLLGKFEKEGVNTELVMGSMRIALGKMARAGEEPVATFKRVVGEIQSVGDAGKANALALALFGARAGPDMAAAIREGRFELGGLLDQIASGPDTIQGLSDETRDAGDAFKELKNQAQLFIGPFVKDLGGLSEALGSSIFLLPALGGVIGRGLGKAWTTAGGGAAVRRAISMVGAAAGVLYQGAVFVSSKFIAAAIALWGMMGGPRVMAAAGAAGTAAGGAYGAAAKIAMVAGVALVANEVKPITDKAGRDLNEMVFGKPEDLGKGAFYGTAADSIGDGIQELWSQLIVNDPLRSEEGKAAFRQARNYQQALERGLDSSVIASIIGGNITDGVERAKAVVASSMRSVGDIFDLSSLLSGGLGQATGIVAEAIESDFGAAVQAIKVGFGNVKQALKNPPQLISAGDRITNMERRVKKSMRELNRAVAANDPVNIAYWTRAVEKQQQRIDGMRRKTGQRVKATRRATAQELSGLVGDISGIDLAGAGRSMMSSLVSGIRSMYDRIRSAGARAAEIVAAYFKSNSPPKMGPLKTIDKDGASLIETWVGGIRSKQSRVAGTARDIAGAFSPSPRIGGPALAAATAGGGYSAGGDTYVVNINAGSVIATDANLRELARRIEGAVKVTRRNRRRKSLAEG